MTTPLNAAELMERAEKCQRMIGEMCREGRPPRMQIPARHDEYNEDLYINDTLETLAAEVVRLENELKKSHRLNGMLFKSVNENEHELLILRLDKLRLEKRVMELEGAIQWIENIAVANYEQDEKLRASGARTLKRITDKAKAALAAKQDGV